ncbi:MAG: response regulator transcription factor [Bradyrhizobium sp.]|nr:response regulator transcription factor [Bradyrhizobium sp.]
MRTDLHSSSRIDETRGLGTRSNDKQDERDSRSRPALGPGEANHRGSAVGRPVISSPPGSHHDGEAAAGSRNDVRVEQESPGLQNFHQDEEGEPEKKGAKKPGIAVIYRRTVFRDCLAQCLQTAYVDHDIFSFPDINEWLASGKQGALDAAVVIIVIDAINESSAADLEILETNAIANPVVIVSDTDDLNHIIRVLKSGVRGYIPTSLSFNVAVEALRLVKAGGVFIPASSIVPDGNEPVLVKNSALLTERQMEVVESIRHGKANKQIAYELKMSEHTVKVHLRHIMRKLKARNRTEVAVLSGNLLAGHKDAPRPDHPHRLGTDTKEDPAL